MANILEMIYLNTGDSNLHVVHYGFSFHSADNYNNNTPAKKVNSKSIIETKYADIRLDTANNLTGVFSPPLLTRKSPQAVKPVDFEKRG